MPEEQKFEARLRGRDRMTAQAHFEASGLRAISEYTRQCVVLGPARHELAYIALVSELCLLVNHLVQMCGRTDAPCPVPEALLKSLKVIVKVLQRDVAARRPR